MQDFWLNTKTGEIHSSADQHDTKRFYSCLKTVYGPPTSGLSPLLHADGSTLLTNKSHVLERWAEHFQNVLNSSTEQKRLPNIARLPHIPINYDLDALPTLDEVQNAVNMLSSGKAPCSDAIPA